MKIVFDIKGDYPDSVTSHSYNTLKEFNVDEMRNKIENNSNIFVDNIQIYGEQISPVLNILKKDIPEELAKKYNLYGLNSDSDFYQIFTYSCLTEDYNNFMKEFIKWQS